MALRYHKTEPPPQTKRVMIAIAFSDGHKEPVEIIRKPSQLLNSKRSHLTGHFITVQGEKIEVFGNNYSRSDWSNYGVFCYGKTWFKVNSYFLLNKFGYFDEPKYGECFKILRIE